MNSVSLIGRLTRDPEVRYTVGTQMAVAKFTLAIDDGYGEKKKTNFIPVTVFGKAAESCEKYLAKGRLCGVEGKIQTGSYTNKDGATVYTTDVIAARVEFLEWGDKKNGSGNSDSNVAAGGFEDVPSGFSAVDEDIPF